MLVLLLKQLLICSHAEKPVPWFVFGAGSLTCSILLLLLAGSFCTHLTGVHSLVTWRGIHLSVLVSVTSFHLRSHPRFPLYLETPRRQLS